MSDPVFAEFIPKFESAGGPDLYLVPTAGGLLRATLSTSAGNGAMLLCRPPRLPLMSARIQTLRAHGILAVCKDGWTLFAEFHRVLAPGGLFLIHESCQPNWLARWLRGTVSFPEVARRLERAGFELEPKAAGQHDFWIGKKVAYEGGPRPTITTTREMKAKQKPHPGKPKTPVEALARYIGEAAELILAVPTEEQLPPEVAEAAEREDLRRLSQALAEQAPKQVTAQFPPVARVQVITRAYELPDGMLVLTRQSPALWSLTLPHPLGQPRPDAAAIRALAETWLAGVDLAALIAHGEHAGLAVWTQGDFESGGWLMLGGPDTLNFIARRASAPEALEQA